MTQKEARLVLEDFIFQASRINEFEMDENELEALKALLAENEKLKAEYKELKFRMDGLEK